MGESRVEVACDPDGFERSCGRVRRDRFRRDRRRPRGRPPGGGGPGPGRGARGPPHTRSTNTRRLVHDHLARRVSAHHGRIPRAARYRRARRRLTEHADGRPLAHGLREHQVHEAIHRGLPLGLPPRHVDFSIGRGLTIVGHWDVDSGINFILLVVAVSFVGDLALALSFEAIAPTRVIIGPGDRVQRGSAVKETASIISGFENSAEGKVTVRGEIWAARCVSADSYSLAVGENVRVLGREGLTLLIAGRADDT